MNAPALQFSNVAKSFRQQQVLRDINLTVQAGECVGLVGMNGAGKTTLLKCLLDFCSTDAGQIDIFGVSHRQTASRLPLAFLPERFMPPYYLTGANFLHYILALQRIEYRPDQVERVLQELDFEPSKLGSLVRQYSKGMTQKLGLAACLIADKALYVLDEPMSGLDPKARVMLKQRLRRLQQGGSAIFFSSHALTDVDEVCDRMAILHQGQLRFVGTPDACRAQFQADTLEQAYMRCIA